MKDIAVQQADATAQMMLPAFCDDWLPEVRTEHVAASVARRPTRGTRHRRATSEPLPYGTRLVVTQRCALWAGDQGRAYEWLFRRARLKRLETRFAWQRACHFRFRAIFGDHGGERLISVMNDPETGRALRLERDEVSGSRSEGGRARFTDWRLPGSQARAHTSDCGDLHEGAASRAASVRNTDYALYRAYGMAQRTVEWELKRGRHEEAADRRGRIDRHVERLDAYYRELRSEVVDPLRRLYHQIAVARVRRQLTHSPQTATLLDQTIEERTARAKKMESQCEEEIGWLEREWHLRREELEARYSLQVRVTLVSAAWVWLPRMALDVELDGEASSSHSLMWDVSAAWPVQDECEGCGRPTAAYTLCKGGHLVCSACASICPDCGRGVCATCASRPCAACAVRMCRDCGRRRRHLYLCSECLETPGIGQLDGWTTGTPHA